MGLILVSTAKMTTWENGRSSRLCCLLVTEPATSVWRMLTDLISNKYIIGYIFVPIMKSHYMYMYIYKLLWINSQLWFASSFCANWKVIPWVICWSVCQVSAGDGIVLWLLGAGRAGVTAHLTGAAGGGLWALALWCQPGAREALVEAICHQPTIAMKLNSTIFAYTFGKRVLCERRLVCNIVVELWMSAHTLLRVQAGARWRVVTAASSAALLLRHVLAARDLASTVGAAANWNHAARSHDLSGWHRHWSNISWLRWLRGARMTRVHSRSPRAFVVCVGAQFVWTAGPVSENSPNYVILGFFCSSVLERIAELAFMSVENRNPACAHVRLWSF